MRFIVGIGPLERAFGARSSGCRDEIDTRSAPAQARAIPALLLDFVTGKAFEPRHERRQVVTLDGDHEVEVLGRARSIDVEAMSEGADQDEVLIAPRFLHRRKTLDLLLPKRRTHRTPWFARSPELPPACVDRR